MTKVVTAVAALRLVEAGRLGLDDSRRALAARARRPPGAAGTRPRRSTTPSRRPRPITLRHLLTNASGYGMVVDGSPLGGRWPRTAPRPVRALALGADAWLARLAALPLAFHAGRRLALPPLLRRPRRPARPRSTGRPARPTTSPPTSSTRWACRHRVLGAGRPSSTGCPRPTGRGRRAGRDRAGGRRPVRGSAGRGRQPRRARLHRRATTTASCGRWPPRTPPTGRRCSRPSTCG